MNPLEQASKALCDDLGITQSKPYSKYEHFYAIITKHMEAVAAEAVKKALAEVKCYNCGEMAVRL